ncbi:MAG: hypothetical protein M3Q47_17470 [Actinomycetota bacterium]|nr:hypothetical protein [Actinomycetota bacterium]
MLEVVLIGGRLNGFTETIYRDPAPDEVTVEKAHLAVRATFRRLPPEPFSTIVGKDDRPHIPYGCVTQNHEPYDAGRLPRDYERATQKLADQRTRRGHMAVRTLASPLHEAVAYFGGAVSSGLIGSVAWEAARGSVAKAWRRVTKPENMSPEEHAELWRTAQEAIISRHSNRLSSRNSILASEPTIEEVDSDGRWKLQFNSNCGDEYSVILGPRRPIGGWAASVRVVILRRGAA